LAAFGLNSAGAAEGRDSRKIEASATLVVAALGPWEKENRLAWRGLELAAQEINQSGGIAGKKLKLLHYDDHDDIQEGLKQAQRIADDPSTAMTVIFSRKEVAVPAATVLAYYGIMTMLTRATASLDEIDLPLLFRMCPDDSEQLAFLTDFCVRQGIKRAVVFVSNGERARVYANTFETEARAKGMEIASRINCDMLTGEESFKRELASLQKKHQFDAIFFSGPAALSVTLFKAAAALGIKQPFLGGYRLEAFETASRADPLKISIYLVTPFSAVADESARRFAENYRQAYGEEPDDKAGIGYAALQVYAQAARRVGSGVPDKVAAVLTRKKRWDGPLFIKSYSEGRFQTLDFGREKAEP
jgi:branched-chain amino acid transport system substrate-binding protein